jgi:drug/metabolite transporter (DMT)-like permease
VMGFSNNLLPFCLIFWAQTVIPSALASILNATTPIFAALVGHYIIRTDRLTANRITGVVLAFVGVACMLLPKLGGEEGGDERHNFIAEIAVLAAALLYAVSGYYGRRFASLPPLIPATGSITCTALMMLPVAGFMEQPWTTIPHTPVVIGSLLALGLLSTALAYVLYFVLLRSAGAANALLVTLVIPVSGTLLGVLVLHEALSIWHFLGMGLVLLGLLATDGRAWQALVNDPRHAQG